MMTLQERMENMKPYFRGIEMYNDALIVKVVYPNNWKYYPSTDGRINAAPSEDGSDVIFYYADSKDTSYDDMFTLIEETIKVNNETILKLKLLRDKVEELKEVFSIKPYEELETLTFTFSTPKKAKPKRKYNKKKKAQEDANKVVSDESIGEDKEIEMDDEKA